VEPGILNHNRGNPQLPLPDSERVASPAWAEAGSSAARPAPQASQDRIRPGASHAAGPGPAELGRRVQGFSGSGRPWKGCRNGEEEQAATQLERLRSAALLIR
jgi:hypothetical protein